MAIKSDLPRVLRNIRNCGEPAKLRRYMKTGLEQAGVLESKVGKVRLLRPAEFPEDWDPATSRRVTIWEAVHHLVRALETGGDTAAAKWVRRLGGIAETARELAYRLYTVAERKSRASEALSYNALMQSWPEITRRARVPQEEVADDMFAAAEAGVNAYGLVPAVGRKLPSFRPQGD